MLNLCMLCCIRLLIRLMKVVVKISGSVSIRISRCIRKVSVVKVVVIR